MFYFYVLESQSDHDFYYGSTSDLKRRIGEHERGLVESTSYRLPIRLLYYEACQTLRQARVREKQVKVSGSVRKALQVRIIDKPEREHGSA